jgi:pyridoxamine 5'-phosphate oxidase
MSPRIESLALVHRAAWQALAQAAAQREHPFRLMSLATVDGAAAALRTVVLREVAADRQQLIFFTDARSPKVAQMGAHPEGSLMVWSAALGWQLRLRVALSVQTDGLAVSSRWARLKLSPAAQEYLSPLPPGAPVAQHQPERATRAQFAVVTAQVMAMDWLELHADGHRRARFDAAGTGQWVTP